jgi:hypothetical protein
MNPAQVPGARLDLQYIAAHALNLLLDNGLRALSHRDHGDYGSDTDDNAQHGER